MSVCHNCERRAPRCHNEATCPDWAKEQAQKAARYKARDEQAMLDATRVTYDKGTGRYIPGVQPYAKGGKRFISDVKRGK